MHAWHAQPCADSCLPVLLSRCANTFKHRLLQAPEEATVVVSEEQEVLAEPQEVEAAVEPEPEVEAAAPAAKKTKKVSVFVCAPGAQGRIVQCSAQLSAVHRPQCESASSLCTTP